VLEGVDGLSDDERAALEAATVVPTSLE